MKLTHKVSLFYLLILSKFAITKLSQELDEFLGVLFETEECEEFLSDASYLSVETIECKPFKCNFPFQICMRPVSQYNNEISNQCRNLPDKCLNAANKSILFLSLNAKNDTFNGIFITTSTISNVVKKNKDILTQPTTIMSEIIEKKDPIKHNKYFGPICEQGVPMGRFCGYELKFTYNRETGRCDQFWYPGCTTVETNNNLFNSLIECQKATYDCVSNKQKNSFGENKNSKNILSTFSEFVTGNAKNTKDANADKTEIVNGTNKNEITIQQPNFIRLIANTLREVGINKKDNSLSTAIGKISQGSTNDWLNRFDPNQFVNIFQSIG